MAPTLLHTWNVRQAVTGLLQAVTMPTFVLHGGEGTHTLKYSSTIALGYVVYRFRYEEFRCKKKHRNVMFFYHFEILVINAATIIKEIIRKYVVRPHESHIMSEKKYFSFWQI